MFHISDLKQFNKCPYLYYLNKFNKSTYFNFYRNDYDVKDIYKEVFNIDNCFIGKTGDNPSLVLENIDKYDAFINARFATSDLRVKVSLLIKEPTGFSLYFFKPILPKELDLDSFFITYDVLKRNGISINSIFLISLNRDYILRDHINFKEALLIDNKYNSIEIIDLVSNHIFDYDSIIDNIKSYKFSEENIQLNKNCSSCIYFNECFNNKLDNDSILHLVSSKYKYEMFNEGIKHIKDVDISRIDGTSLQYAQILASRNNVFIDKTKIKEFLKSIEFNNISFIDFEWDSYLFPKYKGMSCFGIIPFEFCLYIKTNDDLINRYYLGKGDCREEFIEKLIDALPDNGPIVAYNSFSAEVLRLKELAEQFPKYKNKLESIINRFVDLAEIFSKGYYYNNDFKGILTLKNIVNIISSISYSKLNIKEGLSAVMKYREYELSNDPNIEKDLIDYCSLDAYSLFVIYLHLKLLL